MIKHFPDHTEFSDRYTSQYKKPKFLGSALRGFSDEQSYNIKILEVPYHAWIGFLASTYVAYP